MTEHETIFLVDDNNAVRHALLLYLESRDLHTRSYASAEELLADIDARDTGVVVLDLQMKGMSGLELQVELKSRGISLPVIFITGHGSVEHSVQALKEGASDFIEKPFDNEALLESIESALRNERMRRQRRFVRLELTDKFERLTPREREVLTHLVSGTSNKSLAEALGVSSRTIEVHRSRIMTKMAASSLAELVRMAIIMGIITP